MLNLFDTRRAWVGLPTHEAHLYWTNTRLHGFLCVYCEFLQGTRVDGWSAAWSCAAPARSAWKQTAARSETCCSSQNLLLLWLIWCGRRSKIASLPCHIILAWSEQTNIRCLNWFKYASKSVRSDKFSAFRACHAVGQCNACSLICWWTNQAWKKELDNCTLRLIFGKYMAEDHDYVVCLHRNRLKPAEVLNLICCSWKKLKHVHHQERAEEILFK